MTTHKSMLYFTFEIHFFGAVFFPLLSFLKVLVLQLMQLNEYFGSEHKTALCTGLIFYTCRSDCSNGTFIFRVFEGKNHSFTKTAVFPLNTDGQLSNA